MTSEEEAIQQELDRLIAQDLPKAKQDYEDLKRIVEINRAQREQGNGKQY